MKIGFSPLAEADLEDIGDFIARDNPLRAISFMDELREACRKISMFPEAYAAQPDLGDKIRRAVYRRYLIFFSVREDWLRIERILHSARRITPDHFDP